jgi:hypothetical protein
MYVDMFKNVRSERILLHTFANDSESYKHPCHVSRINEGLSRRAQCSRYSCLAVFERKDHLHSSYNIFKSSSKDISDVFYILH